MLFGCANKEIMEFDVHPPASPIPSLHLPSAAAAHLSAAAAHRPAAIHPPVAAAMGW